MSDWPALAFSGFASTAVTVTAAIVAGVWRLVRRLDTLELEVRLLREEVRTALEDAEEAKPQGP